MNYGHLKVAHIFIAVDIELAYRFDIQLLNEVGALSKYYMKVATTVVVNFFMISVIEYYTICGTTLFVLHFGLLPSRNNILKCS